MLHQKRRTGTLWSWPCDHWPVGLVFHVHCTTLNYLTKQLYCTLFEKSFLPSIWQFQTVPLSITDMFVIDLKKVSLINHKQLCDQLRTRGLSDLSQTFLLLMCCVPECVVINPLVPEIFFCEFFDENLGGIRYWF